MRCGIRPGVKIPRTHIKGRAQFVIPAFRWPSQGISLWCKLAPYTTESLVGRRSNINLWPLHADAYPCVPTQMQRHTCTHRLETNNILQVPVIVIKKTFDYITFTYVHVCMSWWVHMQWREVCGNLFSSTNLGPRIWTQAVVILVGKCFYLMGQLVGLCAML